MKRKKKPARDWLPLLLPVIVGKVVDLALRGGLDWLLRQLG